MRLWLVAAIVGFAISVFTKMLADFFLPQSVSIVGAWLRLDYALNPGLAFGVVLSPLLQYILIGSAFIAILWFLPQWSRCPLCSIGTGLILGGGLANLLDRLRDGVVTDFIVLWPLPHYNVADTNIALGALFLVLGEWGLPLPRKALAVFAGKW